MRIVLGANYDGPDLKNIDGIINGTRIMPWVVRIQSPGWYF